jgi:hypothetical protein
MSSPKKNTAYVFYISLVDSADTGAFKASPTIAAGDFQVSGDGAAFADLATLPVVDPAGSIGVKVSLSAAEMNFDKIMVQCIDAAGNEWDDVLIFIDATVANVDDIASSTLYAGPRGPGVYLNDAAANTNTVDRVDGTRQNPVSTIVAAKTIADSLSLDRIYLVNNSDAILVAAMTDYEFVGIGEMMANTVDFGSQDVDNSVFYNLLLTGVQGGTGRCQSNGCVLSAITGMELTGIDVVLAAGTLTLRNDCAFLVWSSAVAGAGAPILNINSVANVNVYMRHGSGGIQFNNAVATTVISVETDGQLVVDATCTGLTVVPRGNLSVTDNGTATNIDLDAAINLTNISGLTIGTVTTVTNRVTADMTYIHGSALTETAGQLAGRFVNFFDQDSVAFNVKTALAHDTPNTWYVSKSGNDGNAGDSWEQAKLTVQAACTAASAGDRVLIGPGTFSEQVALGKSLDVTGSGIGITKITHNSGVTLTSASNSAIRFLTAETTTAAGAALSMASKTDSIFEDCIAVGTAGGIGATSSTRAIVRRCTVTGTGDAMDVSGADDFRVVDCVLNTDCSNSSAVPYGGMKADSNSSGIIEGCSITAARSDTGSAATYGITGGGNMLVRDTFIQVSQANAGGSGDVIGVLTGNSGESRFVVGSKIITTNAGSGSTYDLKQTAGSLYIANSHYDTTKTSGTIVDVEQQAADAALVGLNLDHLCKTATAAADMTAEVADNTIISRMLANGDTSAFIPSTGGLQLIRDVAPHGSTMVGTDGANTTTPPTVGAIADQVWDEAQADHVTVGTFGIIASEIAAIPITAMRGTDSASTHDAAAVVTALGDVYYADVYLTVDEATTQDEYTVQWYKNGAPVISGITVPQIQVVARATGSDLIAATAMTQIGSTGAYKYDEATNRLTAGESAVAYVTATIDGSGRTWRRVVGRDSTA